ncbi:23S rRNA (uracil(1939)-C(5))-methyltransferase RlmD [Lacticaseibacillus chiayiensis]|nr:23S rRNA (uracil(1939)-C(5))-methyltransferase RlmD [Lacticaseibacillus chiayiensis]RXT58167.1 23S rRNA (uracil(1939)-C(5))-methyltransferase RlmD [Lacticaseibacillus chiayiensis]
MAQPAVIKNQDLEVTVQDLTYEGMGVAKVAGFPLFIEDALPGEKMQVHVLKVQKQYGFAKVVKRLTDSPDRVAGADGAYIRTGIAPLSILAYPAQLKFKQHQIEELYKKAHLAIDVLSTIGMKHPLGYRNKAQVPVRMVNGELQTGFYKKHSHDLVPIEDFLIQDPKIDHAIVVVRDLLRKYKVPAYEERTNRGVVRNIMVRRGRATHQMMIVLVSRTWQLPHLKDIVEEMTLALPEVTSVVVNLNDKRTNVILGRKSKTIYGQDYLLDKLLGSEFQISPVSFYQVNPVQTEVLYTQTIEAAGLTGKETVIDAYSGIGTISLTMARHAKHVYGVEVVESAVRDAQANAARNHIKNVTFEVGKAEDVIQKWKDADLPVDVLMVDPPRKGLDKSFIDAVGYMKPPKIVYVSCNPATLARDLQLLTGFGYTPKQTQPVDMFPQTQHIESITAMTLN